MKKLTRKQGLLMVKILGAIFFWSAMYFCYKSGWYGIGILVSTFLFMLFGSVVNDAKKVDKKPTKTEY